MSPPVRILVAMATFNERENLPPLIEQVEQIAPAADLLVVDDNSPDDTGRWAADRAERDKRLRCLHRPTKLGLGSASVAILKFAVDHDYQILITLDADGSHDPRYIPKLLERLEGGRDQSPVDVVIGSRYVPGGGTTHWPLYRRLMSHLVNGLARWLFRLPVRDCSGAYRCMRVELLDNVDLQGIESQGYSFFEESLWQFRQAGARFAEVPIVFANRANGHSKISFLEAASSMATLLRLGLRRRRPS